MDQQLASAIEDVKEEVKRLSIGIIDLKKEIEGIKVANRRLPSIAVPGFSGRGNWDWGTISEEAILGQDPLILPTNIAMETISSTVEALKQTNGATAEEIAQITGRARNTESAYLRRLHLAGKVEKKRDGNKVKYSLSGLGLSD